MSRGFGVAHSPDALGKITMSEDETSPSLMYGKVHGILFFLAGGGVPPVLTSSS